jgi:hypothetical protein
MHKNISSSIVGLLGSSATGSFGHGYGHGFPGTRYKILYYIINEIKIQVDAALHTLSSALEKRVVVGRIIL